ncbi:MAG: twitch domain-containing radical SAM protein [Halobacteriovoraceae bacterium]|jgi:radical SAM protein with 4Fe4S-binding SPASM domain|nr:twitch domain-containing radical SAM protein [Halobacteriovoraceae bacterium]
MDSQTKKKLQGSKTFCMLPWVHLDLLQNGAVYPCCRAEQLEPYGNVEAQSIDQIWNSPKIKELRLQMLAGKKSAYCTDCYKSEECGGVSFRQIHNKSYGHEEAFDLVESTSDTGELKNSGPEFLGIRFSNLCNLKCRYCGPLYSTKWIEDATVLGYPQSELKVVDQASKSGEILKFVESHIDSIKSLYFAGGEPLLESEHFELLELLDNKGKSDIQLTYNSNFSVLDFKGKSLTSIWSKFENVRIDASIDACGAVNDYIRHGVRWETLQRNRLRLQSEAPHIVFRLFPTMSVFNIFSFTDFISDWMERGHIDPMHIHLNILRTPEIYNVQILPSELKQKVKLRYTEFINQVLLKKYTVEESYFLIKQLKELLAFMLQEDRSTVFLEFLEETKKLDSLRGESFSECFPDLLI